VLGVTSGEAILPSAAVVPKKSKKKKSKSKSSGRSAPQTGRILIS